MKLKLINSGPSRVGWHKHGLVLLCAKKYAETYLVEREPEEPGGARLFGTALHNGLAHHYAIMQGQTGLLSPQQAIDETLKDFEAERRHAQGLFKSYVTFWHPEQERKQFRVVAIEQELETQIDGELYTQRIDLITQNLQSGLIFFWDHKSTSSNAAYAAESYQLSGQIIGLAYFGQLKYGAMFGGVTLNMISKKPYGEPRDRFVRCPAPAAPGALAQFENTIRAARARIAQFKDWAPADWPRTLDPLVCGAYGGCDFTASCRWR